MANRAALVAQFHCMEFLIRQTHDPASASHSMFCVVLEEEEEKKRMSMHTIETQIALYFNFSQNHIKRFNGENKNWNSKVQILIDITVVFSRHLNKWWCCNSKISSSRYVSSNSMPDSWAAKRASAAFFLLTNAAPLDAFAIRMRANRAFWKRIRWFHLVNNDDQFLKTIFSHTYTLSFAFVCSLILMIDTAEVRHNDGHRQGDYKHYRNEEKVCMWVIKR